MKITIIPGDGLVGVDGAFRKVSMSGVDSTIHAVQFDTSKGCGHIEYDVDAELRRENSAITDIADFQKYIDAWSVAQAQPDTIPPDPVEVARQAALRALDDLRLQEAALDPLAPQEVKEYAALTITTKEVTP